MIVAITGSSGLIGTALTRALESQGHSVRRVVRRAARGASEISWDPAAGTIDAGALEGVSAVVNLAGENLAQRWTDDVKRRLRDGRVNGTALIARAIAGLATPPRVLLSGSAVGIYGNRGDESLDETSAPGSDFLAALCRDWEAATAPASDAGIRVVCLRTGIVLSKDGGALPKMLLPFRAGVGGRLGSGRQWMSWISLRDTVDAICHLLATESVTGPVNLVAPNPVTNAEFTDVIARVLHRPALFTVPAFAMKLVLGEMADDTVLASQRVFPRRLLADRFTFAHAHLEPALRSVLSG